MEYVSDGTYVYRVLDDGSVEMWDPATMEWLATPMTRETIELAPLGGDIYYPVDQQEALRIAESSMTA